MANPTAKDCQKGPPDAHMPFSHHGKKVLVDCVGQRQARAAVALSLLPSPGNSSNLTAAAEEAVHGLPAMGSLLASLSQAVWACNINKSSLRP